MKIWKILTFFLTHLKPKAYHGKTGVAKKKLGTDTTGARIADGKVYYATYPEGGTHMNKMNVYRCDRNGKNNKLLFTQNVDDENDYIIPEEDNICSKFRETVRFRRRSGNRICL